MDPVEKFLFLVVVGGRSPKANIELHDVRWVIGTKIEDTFDQLRNDWFGSYNGFHIDSYKKIDSVDGYKIKLRNIDKRKSKKNLLKKKEITNKNLWFVNIGGYDPSSMQEKHEFGLVVASTATDAKKLAKSKWLHGFLKKHNDDINCLQRFSDVDDCRLIKNINDWEIELINEDNQVEQTNYPDWFGYLRIDNK